METHSYYIDFDKDIFRIINFVPTLVRKLKRRKEMSHEEHYHYFVSYNFIANNQSFGFGDMTITTETKISNSCMDALREKVLENAKKHDERVVSAVIFAILPLECDCKSEEN